MHMRQLRTQLQRAERAGLRVRVRTPTPLQVAANAYCFEHVARLIEGRPTPPFVATGVVEALFSALERSGMRRINCDECGNEWMTRSENNTCPACREKVQN